MTDHDLQACEAALLDVKAYDHPKTESWNTKIINTILAQLVGETSKPSESSDEEPEAPRYKFVVNSTIVQHRNAFSDSPNSRRGMHSAAGAFWNNEKDGMWSFKYDAGDSKGLDVVVGIVWVWVG